MQNQKNTTVRVMHFPESMILEKKTATEIIVLMKGSIAIGGSKLFEKGTIIMFTPGDHQRFYIKKNTTIIIFSLEDHIAFCKHLVEHGFQKKDPIEEHYYELPLKPQIKTYIETLCFFIESESINNETLLDIKLKELIILLKHYYTQEDLTNFFRPLLGENAHFRLFVLNNHRQMKTVIEFASKANLSLSGFEKEFRRIFQISPYRWMRQKRMEELIRLITLTDKSFKEITEECGFSSTSQMNDFCKKELGKTPGKIRKKL